MILVSADVSALFAHNSPLNYTVSFSCCPTTQGRESLYLQILVVTDLYHFCTTTSSDARGESKHARPKEAIFFCFTFRKADVYLVMYCEVRGFHSNEVSFVRRVLIVCIMICRMCRSFFCLECSFSLELGGWFVECMSKTKGKSFRFSASIKGFRCAANCPICFPCQKGTWTFFVSGISFMHRNCDRFTDLPCLPLPFPPPLSLSFHLICDYAI